MEAVKTGQKFHFAHDNVEAIHLSNPFHGGSMGYHAPSDAWKKIYNPDLLSHVVVIPKTDILLVLNAYQSVSGWSVEAEWNGHYIHFNQGNVDNIEYQDDSTPMLEIERVDSV